MPAWPVEHDDIQGIVRFGHGQLPEASFFLLKVQNPPAARAWLRQAPVTSAVTTDPPPKAALQVALTRQGLQALEVPAEVIAAFSPEFLAGMAEPSRARRLGDVGANEPSRWDWGGFEPAIPDLLVMAYAKQDGLASWLETIQGQLWEQAFQVQACLPTFDIGDIEPFGFADGVSQPRLDWSRSLAADGSGRDDYGNLLALGEVLLGYPNEYGLYTDRPLLNPMQDLRARALPPAEDVPERRDLGRNGTYLVLRQLHQDVRGFWRFLDRQAEGEPERRRHLAEAMVGRRMDGTPLVPLAAKPIAGIGPDPDALAANHFTYADDPRGTHCPFGAHIRRANPRNPDLPGGAQGSWSRLLRSLGFRRGGFREDLVAPARLHRLLRRGREYGTELLAEAAILPGPVEEEPRGIHFICLVGNIARQFEFVQNAWMMSAKFDGLDDESDPVLGNRVPLQGGHPTDRFSLPQPDSPPRRLTGLPPFVTVRGGGYFFLPGLRALRYVAGDPS